MSKKSSSPSRRSGRGAFATASGYSHGARAGGYAAPTSVTRRPVANHWEPDPLILPVDRRHYNPSPASTTPARRFSGVPARVVAPPPVKARNYPIPPQPARSKAQPSKPTRLINPSALLFQASKGVAVCVQRGVRKEVLHAKGVAGKKGLAKPKRGPYSGVKCHGSV